MPRRISPRLVAVAVLIGALFLSVSTATAAGGGGGQRIMAVLTQPQKAKFKQLVQAGRPAKA